ncbi:MAG TPA: helix-turn-helix domain-containing protein [Polyangiaceae bacterium]|nr:helix-turn-helix domain-containing protein [Polyangiaceae bacterium]
MILDDKRLDYKAKLVAAVIFTCSAVGDPCTVEALARNTNLDRPSVERALAKLRQLGIVRWEPPQEPVLIVPYLSDMAERDT